MVQDAVDVYDVMDTSNLRGVVLWQWTSFQAGWEAAARKQGQGEPVEGDADADPSAKGTR